MAYNVLQSFIKQLKERWYPEEDAKKIATKTLQRRWMVKPWTMKLTDKWKARSQDQWNQRKIERVAKKTWRPYYHYIVNLEWNVVLNPLFK